MVLGLLTVSGADKRNSSIIVVFTPTCSTTATTPLAGLENWLHHSEKRSIYCQAASMHCAPNSSFFFCQLGHSTFSKIKRAAVLPLLPLAVKEGGGGGGRAAGESSWLENSRLYRVLAERQQRAITYRRGRAVKLTTSISASHLLALILCVFFLCAPTSTLVPPIPYPPLAQAQLGKSEDTC